MYWVSPWRTTAVDEDWEEGGSNQGSEAETDSLTREWESQPKSLLDDYTAGDEDWGARSNSEDDIYMGEEEFIREKWLKTDRDYEGDWEEEEDEEDEGEESDSSMSTEYINALRGLFPLLQKGQETNDSSWGSEPELEYLRDGESETVQLSRGDALLQTRADTVLTKTIQSVRTILWL